MKVAPASAQNEILFGRCMYIIGRRGTRRALLSSFAPPCSRVNQIRCTPYRSSIPYNLLSEMKPTVQDEDMEDDLAAEEENKLINEVSLQSAPNFPPIQQDNHFLGV